MKNNLKLGIFVALGLIGIMVSIFAVGNISFGRTYDVFVSFPNASGLINKSKVKIAGVDVGVLSSFGLKDSRAHLRLSINNDIVLYENASAKIVSMGIIGTKYISLDPGDSSYPVLPKNSTIKGLVGGSLDDLFSGDMMDNLSSAVKDLKSILNNIAQHNKEIASAISSFNEFSYNLAQITGENREDIRSSIASIKDVTSKLDIIITKIHDGEGAIGALVSDEKVSDDLKETIASAKDAIQSLKTTLGSVSTLQFQWNYLGRYGERDDVFRSDVGLTIMPNDSKFYYVGVSNAGDRNAVNNVDPRDNINTLDALLGFRYKNAEIYGGIMRNKGGVGAGVSLFQPVSAPYRSVYLFANAYDFGREETPTNGKNTPKIDAGVKVGIAKWLYVGAMVEDAADHKPSFTPFIKLEIRDKDIANLFGVAGVASVAGK